MEKNIIALLNSNLRVIIPDFGSFIIRQKQPRIIVFNEFLRYNDGLLIDSIVKTEGIDREIAEQMVSDFAEEGIRILESGRVFIIEGLGSLHKDASGKINFTESGVIRETEEKMVGEPVKDEVQEVSQEIIEKAEPVIPVVRTKVKRGPKVAGKAALDAVPVVNETSGSDEVPTAEEPAVPSATAEVPPLEKPEPPSAPAEVPPAEEPVTPSVPPEVHQKKIAAVSPEHAEVYTVHKAPVKNRANQILAWILVFLFANAIILAWFVFNDEIRGLFRKKPVPRVLADSVYQQLSDSVRAAAMDTSLVYRETEVAADQPVSKAVPSGARYYIVAGCFRDEANADTFVSYLKGLNYKAEKFGKIGNLYAVCFASFDDKNQAVQELKRIREKVPDAWMTRF
jgi:nucleoid DNA-binding protein